MRIGFIIGILLSAMTTAAQVNAVAEKTVLPIEQIAVHDPVMIQQGNTWYLFSTGIGISVKTSTDLKNWKKELVINQADQSKIDQNTPEQRANAHLIPA